MRTAYEQNIDSVTIIWNNLIYQRSSMLTWYVVMYGWMMYFMRYIVVYIAVHFYIQKHVHNALVPNLWVYSLLLYAWVIDLEIA